MRYGNGLPVAFHIDVTTQGQLPGIDDYGKRAPLRLTRDQWPWR